MTEKINALHAIFAQHFKPGDVEGARAWYHKWSVDDDQELPGFPDGFTLRAMAGHVSDYLEGFTGEEPNSYNGSQFKSYMDTKYGSQVYLS